MLILVYKYTNTTSRDVFNQYIVKTLFTGDFNIMLKHTDAT